MSNSVKPLQSKKLEVTPAMARPGQAQQSGTHGTGTGMPLFLQRQMQEDSEELVQATQDSRFRREEKEELPQPRRNQQVMTRQHTTEEEGQELRAKFEHTIHRQPLEEEELIQTRVDPEQVQKGMEEEEMLQPKLEIGAADDEYEKQADEVADQVMRKPLTTVPVIRRQANMLRRQSADASRPQLSADSEHRIQQMRGGGAPLPQQVSEKMGTGMGADFSAVGIHTGNEASRLNREINARAFSVGNDIFFKQGEYAPDSESGQRLLAHELTHVVQQGGGHREAGARSVSEMDSKAIESTPRIDATQVKTIQRSPLSDELSQLWNTSGKGAMYARLRQVAPVNDADFVAFVNTLSGDDLWLTQNIATYGRESNWPIHLRVEREMKGWADTGGKGAVFDILRTANGAEAGNVQLAGSLRRIFAVGSDDIWLAQNLQRYGVEASWPIHLKVEREMKGWADCGGKGVVFDLLRTANAAEAANADLTSSISTVFAPGTDDHWLAVNLQRYGVEANWPIHLRVEREMKGWADCGGKGVVFDLLRTANAAEAANADLTSSISTVFAPGTDDRWLAVNLQRYGVEANWPIHLRVEREMKGWADCGGKAAVFTILRADGGAHANDPSLIAALATVFAAGTEDATLAVLLRKYGAEASWPAPVQEYQCPFDFAPQSSPGERILYNGRYSVVPGPDAHYHELVFTAVNGTFDSATGPATRTFTTGRAANRIDTGNLNFFIPAVFAAGATASVTLQLRQKSTGAVVLTNTWNFTPRVTAPATISQVQSNSAVAIGSSYDYDLGPPLPAPAVAPFYQHQTVLEAFQARTSNLRVADMDPAWITAEHITSKASLDANLFGGSSNNGTFVIDASDQIHDQHSGGTGMLDNAATHLATPKQINVDLPQTYTAGPGNVLGNYTIRRSRKAGGGYELRKFGP